MSDIHFPPIGPVEYQMPAKNCRACGRSLTVTGVVLTKRCPDCHHWNEPVKISVSAGVTPDFVEKKKG